jgi:predicted site-specific integrase-resolvase
MAVDMTIDNMMTIVEVSRIFHIHPTTLRRWADKGVIKSYCISSRGDRRFMARDIEEFIAKTKTPNHLRLNGNIAD